MTKNKLPENWSIKYDESTNMDPVYIALEILDPISVHPWKEYITKALGNGEFINYDQAQKTSFSNIPKYRTLSIADFISLTEEKEEWPKKGEKIMVTQSRCLPFYQRIFDHKKNGLFYCVNNITENAYKRGDKYYTTAWSIAKPIQPKEVPFTPTVGEMIRVSEFDNEGGGCLREFICRDGEKYVCRNHPGAKYYTGWAYAWPDPKTKEVTFSEVAQKFDTTVDNLKIKGYVNEQDAIADAKKILLAEKIADHKPGGKVLISVYEIIST